MTTHKTSFLKPAAPSQLRARTLADVILEQQKCILDLQSRVEELTKHVETSGNAEEIVSLRSQIEGTREDLEKRSEELETIKQNYAVKQVALQKAAGAARQEVLSLRAELKELQSNHTYLTQNGSLNETEQELAVTLQDNDVKEQELHIVLQQLQESKTQVYMLTREVDNLTAQLKLTREAIHIKDAELCALRGAESPVGSDTGEEMLVRQQLSARDIENGSNQVAFAQGEVHGVQTTLEGSACAVQACKVSDDLARRDLKLQVRKPHASGIGMICRVLATVITTRTVMAVFIVLDKISHK